MTKTFNKYEFTPTEWATLRKLIETTTTNPEGRRNNHLCKLCGCRVGIYLFGMGHPEVMTNHMEVA
jgi:hypothetical protein